MYGTTDSTDWMNDRINGRPAFFKASSYDIYKLLLMTIF